MLHGKLVKGGYLLLGPLGVADQRVDGVRARPPEERHGLSEAAGMDDAKPIRILVVDDSAFNRQTITAMLEGVPGIEVVGRAGDGEEGLKLAFQLQPDVITLDLEMPKMDGFTFLRILMARQPTPVIVISGYATRRTSSRRSSSARSTSSPSRRAPSRPSCATSSDELLAEGAPGDAAAHGEPRRSRRAHAHRRHDVGDVRPAAGAGAGAGVAQGGRGAAAADRHRRVDGRAAGHQPRPGQPRADAAGRHRHHAAHAGQVHQGVRRAARSHHAVARARGRDRATRITAGCVLVAPGSGSLIVRDEGTALKVEHPAAAARRSLRAVGGSHAGQLRDGHGRRRAAPSCSPAWAATAAAASRRSRPPGARTVAEAPETAVIFGMPQEAIATGCVDEVVPLPNIPQLIARFAQKK